jgi:hypothetical protein
MSVTSLVRIVSSTAASQSRELAAEPAAFPRLTIGATVFGRVRGCPMAAANDRRYASPDDVVSLARRNVTCRGN